MINNETIILISRIKLNHQLYTWNVFTVNLFKLKNNFIILRGRIVFLRKGCVLFLYMTFKLIVQVCMVELFSYELMKGDGEFVILTWWVIFRARLRINDVFDWVQIGHASWKLLFLHAQNLNNTIYRYSNVPRPF